MSLATCDAATCNPGTCDLITCDGITFDEATCDETTCNAIKFGTINAVDACGQYCLEHDEYSCKVVRGNDWFDHVRRRCILLFLYLVFLQ